MTAPAEDWIQAVLQFWFKELKPEAWFGKDPVLDQLIRVRFGALYEQRKESAPETTISARGSLAAVIVLDQFPRNMYRGLPQAFATDQQALAISQRAIGLALDLELDPQQRAFLYMPFQHSEDRTVQERSVELFAALGNPETLAYAREHHAIIEQFGRFPHRNAILGRTSSAQELEFLKTHSGF
jgi:uncharacterized protein (DUF924 family)